MLICLTCLFLGVETFRDRVDFEECTQVCFVYESVLGECVHHGGCCSLLSKPLGRVQSLGVQQASLFSACESA